MDVTPMISVDLHTVYHFGYPTLFLYLPDLTTKVNFFLTQHVLEPTREKNVLDIVLSSQKELVDNVKIFEPLGNSDHN